jgi:hypothetical protein
MNSWHGFSTTSSVPSAVDERYFQMIWAKKSLDSGAFFTQIHEEKPGQGWF